MFYGFRAFAVLTPFFFDTLDPFGSICFFSIITAVDKESDVSLPFSSLKRLKITLNSSTVFNSIASRR